MPVPKDEIPEAVLRLGEPVTDLDFEAAAVAGRKFEADGDGLRG